MIADHPTSLDSSIGRHTICSPQFLRYLHSHPQQVLLAESAKGEQMSAIEAQKMIADHARDMDELRTDSDRRISKLQVRLRLRMGGLGLRWCVLSSWGGGYPPTEGSENQLQRQGSESQMEDSFRVLEGSVRILKAKRMVPDGRF